jgi:phosphohistidine phosphatase
MTHTLLLIRHAKAVGDAATDTERQLAPRGIRDARALGRWLVEHDLVPDYAVVSPARRAVQTWETAASELGDVRTGGDDRIYENTLDALLAVILDVAEEPATVAVVGHNPSMHALAVALDDGRGDESSRTSIAASFPTSGVAVFDLAVSWAALTPGGATVRAFATPRG